MSKEPITHCYVWHPVMQIDQEKACVLCVLNWLVVVILFCKPLSSYLSSK